MSKLAGLANPTSAFLHSLDPSRTFTVLDTCYLRRDRARPRGGFPARADTANHEVLSRLAPAG
jgi:hypothetical protein